LVTPGWLRRLLHHAEVDAKSGCIGPVSNRAAHGQQVPFDGPTDPASLARHAEAWAVANVRRAKIQNVFDFLLSLDATRGARRGRRLRRALLALGLRGRRLHLRAALAGFRNRIALDVFVRHEHYDDPAKSARHTELLARNWRQFARKWSGSEAVEYGDYKAIERVLLAGGGRDQIHLPLARLDAIPAALPASARESARSQTCNS
jgi:hypothetical protein